jgi:putative peptidoglycan lipid II flippase
MLPYMIIICTVAILAGILNTHRHFVSPAAAPIVLNIFIITALLLTGWVFEIPPAKQVFMIAGAVLAAGLVQIAIQVPALRAKGVTIRPAWDIHSQAFRKVIFLMAPMIIGITATQLNTLADTWIAKFFSGSVQKGDVLNLLGMQLKYPLWDGAVSHLYYSQRLYQFPLGVLGISLATAIFPVMSADAIRSDLGFLRRTINRGAKSAIFISIPAIAGLILVARPLASVVFEGGAFSAADTEATSRILFFYALGLCGFFSQQIFARGFYAMQDSIIPMRSGIIAVIVNIILNLTLIWFMGTAGLALSTAICSYLQVIILVIVLRRKLGSSLLDGLLVTFMKTFIAVFLMSAAGLGIISLMKNYPDNKWFNILRLIMVVPSAAGVYLLVSGILRVEVLSLLIGRKRTGR